VSLSPNVTEVLFALGVDSSRIAGVTRFCDYPPAARRRPQVGGIIDPSPEVIVAARPDLVLAVRGNPRPVLRQLEHAGLPVLALEDRTSLRGVAAMMKEIARAACPEVPARSDSMVAWYEDVLTAYESWSAAVPQADRPTVYYADPQYPTWTAGKGSHIDDLVRLAGGVNVAGSLPGWPQMSMEQLVLVQPRYLLLAVPENTDVGSLCEDLATRPGWSALAALQERRICWIAAARLQRPGPRIAEVLEELAGCLHSERDRPFSAGSGRSSGGPQ
jgi:iron complex transport system substrate-binding protein